MTDTDADDFHYPAALYELVHRGTAGDLSFYARSCRGARRVLELGCGYGRVLAALQDEPGLELCGLDRDSELLARARNRLPESVELVPGDMCNFDLDGRRFDRILIPHSGLYCLPDDAACVSCFAACCRHLAPGGQLVFDAYAADLFHLEADPADHDDLHLEPLITVESDGTCYDVFERSLWNRPSQRVDVSYEYIPRGGGEAALGRLRHRYLLLDQIEALLQRAGLRLLSLAGDWQGQPADPQGDMWVATAAATGSP